MVNQSGGVARRIHRRGTARQLTVRLRGGAPPASSPAPKNTSAGAPYHRRGTAIPTVMLFLSMHLSSAPSLPSALPEGHRRAPRGGLCACTEVESRRADRRRCQRSSAMPFAIAPIPGADLVAARRKGVRRQVEV